MFRIILLASGVTCGLSPLTKNTAPITANVVRKPTTAKKPTRRRRMPSGVSDQRAMAQKVISEDAGHHRLAYRNGADSDARVVPTLGFDLDFVAIDIDGAHRMQDRAGRLHRKARDDVLAGRDPAEDAAGIVGQKDDTAVFYPHLIAVLFPTQLHRSKTCADLDTFDGVDRHQRAGEISVELVIDRLAQPCWDTTGDDLDDGARRRSGLTHPIEVISP